MKWFSEKEIRYSEKNGEIQLWRQYGRRSVWVGGAQQTGDLLNDIWLDAYERVKKQIPVQGAHVLLLGLGAGGTVPGIYKTFKDSHIDAVEYDPQMIALTKELKLYEPFDCPNILEGDAARIVPGLRLKYDLVIVDLFDGVEPSALVINEGFLLQVEHHLAPKGVLLINVLRGEEKLGKAKELFTRSEKWRYRTNIVGAFWRE